MFSNSPYKLVYNKKLDRLVPAESSDEEDIGEDDLKQEDSETNLSMRKYVKSEGLNNIDSSEEIMVLRSMYPNLIHHNNLNEDNWYCDVCLDTGEQHVDACSQHNDDINEPEDLVICDLCLVVVHPSCYRRDLYL